MSAAIVTVEVNGRMHSDECHCCGRKKEDAAPLCYDCFTRLPRHLRPVQRFHQRLEAWLPRAAAWLRENPA